MLRRCLITGGAGFLGINLARFLLGRGMRVRSLDIAAFDYPEADRVDAMVGDVRDAVAVESAMAEVDVVVHGAAALPLASADEILSTDIDGTRIMLEGALRRRVSRFVYISSTAVYGIPHHRHPIREEDSLDGVGPYGQAKVAAERLCADFRTRGLCVPVLRPKTFVGPERLGVFEILYEWAYQGRSFPVLGSGGNRYQLLDVADLCDVIGLCLTLDPRIVNTTFNVGAKDFGTMRENIQAVLDRAGHGRKVISVPEGPAVFALRVLRALGLSPLYEWVYETAALDSSVSIDRLVSTLGYTPSHSNKEALIANYDWYVAHRGEFAGKSGITHRVPWKRGVLEVAKWFF